MGLDMFLTKKIYVGAEYEHRKITGKIEIFENGKPIKVDLSKVSYIEERAGYWRKANQIHKWFVENVQDNKDDCGEYCVGKEKLTELLEICKKVKSSTKLVKSVVTNGYSFENGVRMPIIEDGKQMKDSTVAEELLPTASGFFFGSTDYDEYYMADIDDTIEILELVLADVDEDGNLNGDIYYSSSW